MRKLTCMSAVVALAAAFAFAGAAYAAPGGNPGKPGGKKHAAFNAFVADPVPCADAVAVVPTGSIAVGLDEPQCYTYDMVIEDAEVGSVHRDELTANWDLDGASEAAVDDATGFSGSGAAEDAATGGGAGNVSGATEDCPGLQRMLPPARLPVSSMQAPKRTRWTVLSTPTARRPTASVMVCQALTVSMVPATGRTTPS